MRTLFTTKVSCTKHYIWLYLKHLITCTLQDVQWYTSVAIYMVNFLPSVDMSYLHIYTRLCSKDLSQVTALYVCILSCHEALKVGSDLWALLIFIFFYSLDLTVEPLKKGSSYVKSERKSVCLNHWTFPGFVRFYCKDTQMLLHFSLSVTLKNLEVFPVCACFFPSDIQPVLSCRPTSVTLITRWWSTGLVWRAMSL